MIVFCGQLLSLLLCATGTASQKLVTVCNVKVPGFQGFINYCLLSLVFTTKFVCSEEFLTVFKERWWKYLLIGVVDCEANFLVYKAYQYTSLTSVQLLDCLSIPVVVLLSIVVLRAKYRPIHFFGILICLGGLGFLIWADLHGSQHQGPKSAGSHSELIGDILVIGGAIMYAMSNIAEEFVVKTTGITEFLGMMSFFGCFASGANVIIFERQALSDITWDYKVVLLLVLSALAMFGFYSLMPVLISHSSATLVNLTLLTADLYSLFVGLYLFNYTFSHLYIISFVVIVVGVIIFKVFPTPSRVDHETTETIINDDEEQEALQDSWE